LERKLFRRGRIEARLVKKLKRLNFIYFGKGLGFLLVEALQLIWQAEAISLPLQLVTRKTVLPPMRMGKMG